MAIFLDLDKAFDSVDCQKLLGTLVQKATPSKVTEWIYEYLRERQINIQSPEGTVAITTNTGLPQGCPLSPLLFNIYTASLHELEEDGVVLVQFADDFTILVFGEEHEIVGKANRYLAKLNTRLTNMNLKINPRKCAAINFSKIKDTNVILKIREKRIEIVNTHKYLGYTIDRGFKHRKHIEEVVTKAGKSINMLKMISNRRSPADPETMIKIGNALIRTKIEYGAVIYGTAAKSNKKR